MGHITSVKLQITFGVASFRIPREYDLLLVHFMMMY